MQVDKAHYEAFKNGSKTYFNSSLFFPNHVRRDVFLLYGFVRVADDFVDAVPQQTREFHDFVARYRRAAAGEPANDPIVDGFVELKQQRAFEDEWVEGFFHSMDLDLHKSVHQTLEEALEYTYGSAEVIGLFMSRILGLPEAAFAAAAMQGRAMQYINFVRDIAEDNHLGRIYLPIGETSLPNLHEETARQHGSEFETFVQAQLERYRTWQAKAEEGYRYIPKRYLVPIKTAADMYKWTAKKIGENPYRVYENKIKPPRTVILFHALSLSLRPRRSLAS